jgi:hypothetical protein
MASIWPWLAVAGLGALHGMNPATGWMFAAAWGVKSGDRTKVLRALLPLAVGHVASLALVAGAIALAIEQRWLQTLAGGLLIFVFVHHLLGRRRSSRRPPAQKMTTTRTMPTGNLGLALWSFIMSTAHGAGLMLVPALGSICISDSPAREITASGSLALALAAVGVHALAMLLVVGLVASGVCAVLLRRTTPRSHFGG